MVKIKYKLKIVILSSLLFLVFGIIRSQNNPQIFINEFLASNSSTNLDPDFSYFVDWIEIYNAGNESVNLNGFYITDDLCEPTKWQIPVDIIIPTKSYIIIYADEKDTVLIGLHTNFKLKCSGEQIALLDINEIIIDSLTYNEQIPDISFGRSLNVFSEWLYFGQPTPCELNSEYGLQEPIIAPSPEFSIKGGFYNSSQTVSISVNPPIGTIYYTLDGSQPDENSEIYSSPIEIKTTVTIRARVLDTSFLPGPIITHSYLIKEQTYLPVISIAIDNQYLWDPEIGIFSNWFKNWERPVNIELFEQNGKPGFNIKTGIKIYGNKASGLPQKALSIHARNKYDNDMVNYKIFDEKSINKFKSFILRNSSQDWSNTFFRDAMMQTLLIGQMDIDYQAYKPFNLFLNGRYWGIYNAREKINEHYINSNYGIDPENIDFLERENDVIVGDTIHYNALLNFIKNNDITLSENYDYVKTQLDIEEYINYQIAQIYFANTDWPHNNIKFWRSKINNGKWRWIIFDTDFGFGLQEQYTHNTFDYATNFTNWINYPFTKLLENTEFKDEFIQQFANCINLTFHPDRVIKIIDSLKANLDFDMNKHIEKWGGVGGIPSFDEWESNIQVMRDFAINRPSYVRQHIIDKFGLSGACELSVNISDTDAGRVFINDVAIPDSIFIPDNTFTGVYFQEVPIKLIAVPKYGFKFVKWQGISSNDSVILLLNYDTTLTAIFEPDNTINKIFINEFMASNNGTIADPQGEFDDWIEIYNSGTDSVDIGGMFITDDLSDVSYQIPTSNPDSTTIPPKGFLLLWADKDSEDGILHLDFKLSASGEQIGLFAPDGITIIDSITFGEQTTDISYGRISDGNPEWVFMEASSPGQSNMLGIKIDLKVFLEGPFNGIDMNTDLNIGGLLPLTQPYSGQPWNYSGTESVTAIPNGNIVDWVLVELRETTGDASTATSDSIIAQQAAFLLNDGSVVGLDGIDAISCVSTTITNNLFVVIWHRNHLGVMSAYPLIETGGVYSYDFSISEGQAYGGALGHKEIATGIWWGMIGSDGYPDGQINNADKNDVWAIEAGTSGYLSGDFNMDTQVANSDKNDIWMPNSGKGSQVLENIPGNAYKSQIPK